MKSRLAFIILFTAVDGRLNDLMAIAVVKEDGEKVNSKEAVDEFDQMKVRKYKLVLYKLISS